MSNRRCCVPGCYESGKSHTALHTFPNPEKERKSFNLWMTSIGGDILGLDNKIIHKYRRVCRAHFEEKFLCRSNRINNVAIPTLHLPGSHALPKFQLEIKTVTPKKPTNKQSTLTDTASGATLSRHQVLVSLRAKGANEKLHNFPSYQRNPERFKIWVHIAGGKLNSVDDLQYYKKKRICDRHFTEEDRARYNRLHFSAIPTLHLPEHARNNDECKKKYTDHTYCLPPPSSPQPPLSTHDNHLLFEDLISSQIHKSPDDTQLVFIDKDFGRLGEDNESIGSNEHIDVNNEPIDINNEPIVVNNRTYAVNKRTYPVRKRPIPVNNDPVDVDNEPINDDNEPINDDNEPIDDVIEESSVADFVPKNEIFSWQRPIEAILASDDENATEENQNLLLYCEDEKGQPILVNSDGKTHDDHLDHQYVCNFCNEPIIKGFRYRCVQCADCDVCVRCETAGCHPEHYVLRIPPNRPRAEMLSVLSRIRSQLLGGDNPLLTGDALVDSVKDEVKEEEQCEPDPLWAEEAQLRVESVERARPHYGDADPDLPAVAPDVQEDITLPLERLLHRKRERSVSPQECGENVLYDGASHSISPRKKKGNVKQISSCPKKNIIQKFNDDDDLDEVNWGSREKSRTPFVRASPIVNKLRKRKQKETNASPLSSPRSQPFEDFSDDDLDDETWVPEPDSDQPPNPPNLLSCSPLSSRQRKQNKTDATYSSAWRCTLGSSDDESRVPDINESLKPLVRLTRTVADLKGKKRDAGKASSSPKRQFTRDPVSLAAQHSQPSVAQHSQPSLAQHSQPSFAQHSQPSVARDNCNFTKKSRETLQLVNRAPSSTVPGDTDLVITQQLINRKLVQQPTVQLRALSRDEINSMVVTRSDVKPALTDTVQESNQQTIRLSHNMNRQRQAKTPQPKAYQPKRHRPNNEI